MQPMCENVIELAVSSKCRCEEADLKGGRAISLVGCQKLTRMVEFGFALRFLSFPFDNYEPHDLPLESRARGRNHRRCGRNETGLWLYIRRRETRGGGGQTHSKTPSTHKASRWPKNSTLFATLFSPFQNTLSTS